jgi:hypothetical protein
MSSILLAIVPPIGSLKSRSAMSFDLPGRDARSALTFVIAPTIGTWAPGQVESNDGGFPGDCPTVSGE